MYQAVKLPFIGFPFILVALALVPHYSSDLTCFLCFQGPDYGLVVQLASLFPFSDLSATACIHYQADFMDGNLSESAFAKDQTGPRRCMDMSFLTVEYLFIGFLAGSHSSESLNRNTLSRATVSSSGISALPAILD